MCNVLLIFVMRYVLKKILSEVYVKHYYCLSFLYMDMAEWLARGALPMSLPVVRFRIPLGAGFLEKMGNCVLRNATQKILNLYSTS